MVIGSVLICVSDRDLGSMGCLSSTLSSMGCLMGYLRGVVLLPCKPVFKGGFPTSLGSYQLVSEPGCRRHGEGYLRRVLTGKRVE